MDYPLVSVICLCYNHERFVVEAIESVLSQNYPSIELIVVDDASTDRSKELIESIVSSRDSIRFINLLENHGNCAAFNIGLRHSQGKYIIDFATDDIMLPERIEQQVNFFESLSEKVGVIFSDAIYVNAEGVFLRNHFEYLQRNKLIEKVPEGDVFREVLSSYFIPSPTMMIRRVVFDELKGYDESLSYEDFDFWVRSSRLFDYRFLDKRLTKIRRTGMSMSSGWYQKGDRQLHSSYLVCRKAVALCRNESDRKALLTRLRYEVRQSIFSENHGEAKLFFALIGDLQKVALSDRLMMVINALRLPLRRLRFVYHLVRFK